MGGGEGSQITLSRIFSPISCACKPIPVIGIDHLVGQHGRREASYSKRADDGP